ncbi:AAA family ATPase [Thioalkalivibrio nitratireducens DSM 14787]|uniref:AAA family ATPase n=1 Tax=Thioalkalivibrio nitratireducens (strain DSM 14787 / UNIQEM 213 / ALEN2) TaxID=1255043 RepID=L0DXM0_THIND|nr:ATP-binding protein [Thioalkalivibrio nitratireducens]AGA33788.1 AAA family ATPase [Thioalkalivibrio nitratireducens DSM 14787]
MSRPVESLPWPQAPEGLRALLRAGLAEFIARSLGPEEPLRALVLDERSDSGARLPWAVRRDLALRAWPPRHGALARLVEELGLDLPQGVLLALAGESEASHPVTLAVAELQTPGQSARPTVHLAVALLQALFGAEVIDVPKLCTGPLLRHQVLELEGDDPLPLQQLRISPALWAVLTDSAVDWPQGQVLTPLRAPLLASAAREQAPRLAAVIGGGAAAGLVLRGAPGSGRSQLAALIGAELGRQPLQITDAHWLQQPAFRLASRFAGWLPVLSPRVGPGEAWQGVVEPGVPLVVLLGRDGTVEGEGWLELELPLPTPAERRRFWRECLPAGLADECAGALLSGPAIARVAASAKLQAAQAGIEVGREHLLRARRELGAASLRLLAQPLECTVGKDALVVPEAVQFALEALIARVHQREAVWEGLGQTLAATRTPGVRALFVGESGTGKTLAASYVATALAAPLYRVDLAAVMNKYIGESEKNLAALLDQAAACDAALLFDEADALFGRRSDGKDTGERYANMLTNFLLSRIETHPGLVILTSNSRERIDGAFNRRLDAVIEFPLPRFAERLALWHSHFGARVPGADVCRQLASHCDLTGGQIRNVVLHAAVATAAQGPIAVPALLAALRKEYDKLGRGLPTRLERLGG